MSCRILLIDNHKHEASALNNFLDLIITFATWRYANLGSLVQQGQREYLRKVIWKFNWKQK